MTFVDWVLGVVTRPGFTFEKARHELRFGYWWIMLSVFTLEVLVGLYSPMHPRDPLLDTGTIVLWVATYLLILFDVQALLLWVTAKGFGWQITWPDALKYIGLGWSLILVDNIVTFYPSLKGYKTFVVWSGVVFFAWYLLVLTIGVRRVSGFTLARSLALTLVASSLWGVGFGYLTWQALSQ